MDQQMTVEQRLAQLHQETQEAAALVVGDLGGHGMASVCASMTGYDTNHVKPKDWENAAAWYGREFPGLRLQTRFSLLPYWCVCRFVQEEPTMRRIPERQRQFQVHQNHPDDPTYLAELNVLDGWLEQDGTAHPEIRRYSSLDDSELRVLARQSDKLLPFELMPAAFDRGWLAGTSWAVSNGWSGPWLRKLAGDRRLAHFYGWLKSRNESRPG
jgi:hypothetical protein